MTTANPPTLPDHVSIQAASDGRLRTVFPPPTIVWLVTEAYDPLGPVWRVTLIFLGERGRWMWRRYRYDIPSNTLHFAGEQPATAADVLTARRNGRRL